MFMTEPEYKETLDLLSKSKKPTLLLEELDIWAREFLQAVVYNYFCDTTKNGLLRLRLVLWDFATERKMHDGPNLDKAKQRKVAEKFAELARIYQIHQEYWDAEDIFVCYETIRDEIQKDILKRVGAGIRKIRHPDIWKIEIFFENIHIFYETDEQIIRNQENGVSDNVKCQCSQLVKKHDVYNVFPQGANCIFSSHQTINEKFHGNMFFYYHG